MAEWRIWASGLRIRVGTRLVSRRAFHGRPLRGPTSKLGQLAVSVDSVSMETDFLPAEWTCLFPGPTPPFQPLLRVAPPDSPADNNNGPGASAAAEAPESDDPGASFRAANPLTFDAMMATLTSPFLRVIAFLGASPRFSFIGWRVAAQDTLTFALILALLGLAWSWNDGTFGTKQLVLGFVSAALFLLVMAGSLWLNAIAVPQVPKLLDFAAPAVLCRWLQLTNGGGPAPGEKPTMAEDAPRLVRHENGDAMCPCTDCVGNVQLLAGVLCALDLFFLGCLGTLVSWTTAWTAVVTFGARLWSIWWGYLLGALYGTAAAFVNGLLA
ncbi:hypothetical protein DFJ74DRAFT_249027 [Hyaloraphidium curvatum]|nr:hypothetical protein DFJ74DRAFT_249027 [Hyaloraphidium curvatum]